MNNTYALRLIADLVPAMLSLLNVIITRAL